MSSLYQTLQNFFKGSTPNHYAAKTAVIGAALQTTGTGLSDITSGGTYTATVDHVYRVKITVAAGTDKFQYSVDGGAYGNEVSLTGAAQNLANGVQVTFTATTGHTLNDVWTITVTGGVAVVATTLSAINVNSVGNGAELKLYNGSDSTGVLIYDGLTANWSAGQRVDLGYKLSSGHLYVVLYATTTYPDLIIGTI